MRDVVAALVAAFAALDALAVDDPGAGVALPSFHLPEMFPQMRVDVLPELVAFPESVIMIDRAPRREVRGQVPPLATGAHDIEHGIEQFAIGVFAWAPGLAGLGETVVD